MAQGVPSLPTANPGEAAVFSVVPIGGVSTPLTGRVSVGAYGLYSTDPQVEILCVAAPTRLSRLFTLNPIYEFIAPPKSAAGVRQSEQQINLALDTGFTWKRLRLDDRNRVGRRFVAHAEDSTRYRNLPSVALDLRGRSKITLFHWQEFFYEGNVHRWDQHHLAAGVERPLGHGLLGQAYYFRLAAVGRGDIHALGLTLIYSRDRAIFHK